MFGNGFSRNAIVNARVLAARLDRAGDPKLSKAARELVDVSHRWSGGRREGGDMTYMVESLDALEFEDVVAFFALLAKRDGIVIRPNGEPSIPDELSPGGWRYLQDRDLEGGGAVGLADAYACVHDPAGVTIHVENSDGDPMRVDFTIHDPIANAWADRHGSLDGGTWETVDGDDFVYDGTYWRPGLFDELRKEGFDLDFSAYDEPDERDLAIAAHAADCSLCEGDFGEAAEEWDDALQMAAHERLAFEKSLPRWLRGVVQENASPENVERFAQGYAALTLLRVLESERDLSGPRAEVEARYATLVGSLFSEVA